jgi:sugar-specific transcriptional regulator TrmB
MLENIKKIKKILLLLDLTSLEAEVFLANFELGPAAASAIAKKASSNRVTVYEVLKRLSKKGLIKIRAKQNTKVKYFEAQSMDVVEQILTENKGLLDEAIKDLREITPDINSLFSGKQDKPEVLFFQGTEGVKNVLMDTLKQRPKEIISFSSADSLESGFNKKFLQGYWDKRTTLKIPSRGIMPRTKVALANFTNEKNQKELRQVKFIPCEYYSFSDEIDIYGDNVCIISFEKDNEHAVIIRSKNIAEGIRSIYKLLWFSSLV